MFRAGGAGRVQKYQGTFAVCLYLHFLVLMHVNVLPTLKSTPKKKDPLSLS